MLRKTDGRSRVTTVWTIVLSCVSLTGACTVVSAVGLRFNTSYSLPMGLYIATNDPAATLIEFCPADRFAKQSSERGYRTRGIACSDDAVPLLKPIVAKDGDLVETTPSGIKVNGQLLSKTAPLPRDSQFRSLEPWPFGIYRVPPGAVWVASTYHRGSYDSRYMGPISMSQIRRRLRPLWTF